MPRVDERLLDFAKALRTEMTPAEARLWYQLRAKRLNDVKFVRQSVRRPFIADFIARSHKLIIEIDGDTHGMSETYDARRTTKLEREGYRVLRFSNADVMGNVDGVLAVILDALRPDRCPLFPLPSGERVAERSEVGRGAVANRAAANTAPLPSAAFGVSLPLPRGEREV